MKPLRILIVTDQALLREGVTSALATRPDLAVIVGEAQSGQRAERLAGDLSPDVALVDVHLPGEDGVAVAARLRGAQPPISLVMLSSCEGSRALCEALKLGVSGYLSRNSDVKELFGLLEGIARREARLTPDMAVQILNRLATATDEEDACQPMLTLREFDVLHRIAEGHTNEQIARELCISRNTVKTHLRHIMQKLRLENRTQVANFAASVGAGHRLVRELASQQAKPASPRASALRGDLSVASEPHAKPRGRF